MTVQRYSADWHEVYEDDERGEYVKASDYDTLAAKLGAIAGYCETAIKGADVHGKIPVGVAEYVLRAADRESAP